MDTVKDCNEDDTKPTQYYVEMIYVNHMRRLLKSHGWDTDSSKSLHSEMVSSTLNFDSIALIESNCECTLSSYYFEYVTKLCSSRPSHYSLSAAETVSASTLVDASSNADQVENTLFKLVDVSVTEKQVRIAMFKILVKQVRIAIFKILVKLIFIFMSNFSFNNNDVSGPVTIVITKHVSHVDENSSSVQVCFEDTTSLSRSSQKQTVHNID